MPASRSCSTREMAHAKVLRIDDAGPHRRLQPRRPVALPQRRARPAVRGPGRRRADRAEHLRRAGRRCRRRPAAPTRPAGAGLERHDGPRLAVPLVERAARASHGAYSIDHHKRTEESRHEHRSSRVHRDRVPGQQVLRRDHPGHQGAPGLRHDPGPRPGDHHQGRRRQRHRHRAVRGEPRDSRRPSPSSASRAGTCSARRTSRTSAPRSTRTAPRR